jgi:DNA-damage-inducible protein J
MSTTDTYVRARIDTSTKERAADALEAMGLSISDAIRLLMLRIADERRMPFDVKAPNSTTRKAIAELARMLHKRCPVPPPGLDYAFFDFQAIVPPTPQAGRSVRSG